ncbi:MAG: pilus assembly protein [Alphaproteobacteria bacterium]|uniref:TadE/TadG family type IV pilus assembly protein n=1 Tax=Maricaulis alexandrii TaxID=2570354 RepID=UPI001108D4ED|nr:TadE/TadG family type IV pilus assembly protein [Maricaulis alexandrii]MCR9266205.1 pilus assembly protein [Alphaproteobacteria bacterium]
MRADRHIWRRFGRDRSGAGALEFALISPALIFLIIGVIQISLALYKGSTVQWIAERAVRTAMIDASVDAAALTQLIESDLAEMGEDLQVQVAFQIDDTGAVPIGRIQVDYAYPVALPLVETFYATFSVDSVVPMPQV